MLEPRQAFEARDEVRIGWVWWSVGGQVPSSVLCSLGAGDRAGVPRNRALRALIQQVESWGFHRVGNKTLGNCFERGKLIVLEEIEKHEVKVRETSEEEATIIQR